jgi:hypothetical protein
MAASVFLIAVVLCVGQAPKEVSEADKQAFFKLLSTLEFQPAGHGAIFTETSVKKAAPFAPVLFALTEKDVQKKDLTLVLTLSLQLVEVDEARKYGIKNFARIAHPRIKLYWATTLFGTHAAPPEIVAHLRQGIDREGENLDYLYGPAFQTFKERVILADEIAKQSKVELVKKHVQKNRFPDHGGGFSYTAANCIFAPGPLLIAVRPLNNDGFAPDRGKQGELFTSDVAKGTTSRRLIPPIKPDHETTCDFNSPILSINPQGDLLCRWTILGNGDHGFALLKKGADKFAVNHIKDLYIAHAAHVVADPSGAWYLIHWEPGECRVFKIDDALKLTQLGKLTSAEFTSSRDCEGRFITKDVLHVAWELRSVDFHVNTRKWLHHRELYRPEQPGAQDVTAIQLANDSLHHLWSMNGGKEHANMTGVYCQAESRLEPVKICASVHYRAVAVGNRLVVCYTLEDSPTKVFFRVIHHGTLGPISELAVENKLDYSLWRDSLGLHAEGDRIWFVNSMKPDTVFELQVVDRNR